MFQNNEYKQNKRPRFANFKNINLESAKMSWRGQASLAQKFLRSEESFVRGGRYFSVDYVTLKVCKNGLLCKLLVSLPNCDEFTGTSTNAPRTYIKGIYFGFQSV